MDTSPEGNSFNKANALFVNEQYQEAASLYDDAVKQNPQNSQCLLARAANNLKLEKYQEVLSDCKTVLKVNPVDHLGLYRLGLAQFYLDDFKSANDSFLKSKEIAKTNKCNLWIRKCGAEFRRLGDVSKPVTESISPSVVSNPSASSSSSTTVAPIVTPAPVSSTTIPVPTPVAGPTATSGRKPITDNWYQSKQKVTITIFVKNLRREDVTCDHTSTTLSVAFQNGDEQYSKKWNFFASVIPEQTEVSVSPYKIEVVFTKEKSADWLSLEKLAEEPMKHRENVQETSGKVDPKKYPTSSANKTDWEEMDVQVKKELEAEKPEGDAALHKLFQSIYSGADEDTRRAMIKSYQTSGGTVLSTNWKEVAKSDYENDIQAPAGQEVRKWNK